MSIVRLQASVGRVFRQRCFYLFVSLVALIAASPMALESDEARLILQIVQVVVLVAAVAAVGRSTLPFAIALLVGAPALGLQVLFELGLDDTPRMLILANAFYVAFYLVAIAYLLQYVFRDEVMSDDKLFGAAAAYLMLGVAWAYAYSLVLRLDAHAFSGGTGPSLSLHDFLFMSFGLLTSNGPGDVVAVGAKARTLVILEQVTGTLFVAILIARLAGIYPPRKRES
jgi:hypothetical protein